MCAKMKGTRIYRNSEILQSIGWQSFLRIQGCGIFPSWFFGFTLWTLGSTLKIIFPFPWKVAHVYR